jgi:predicted enzyme related to lactoylglutathione lyase
VPDVYHSCKVHYYYESVQVHGGDVDKKSTEVLLGFLAQLVNPNVLWASD